jgi:hypothetical protein
MREDEPMTDPFATPSGDPARETVAIPPGGGTPPPFGTPPPVYNAPPPYGAPPGQPPYGTQPYGAPVQGQGRNGFGVTALVLGILSIVPIAGLAGIPGLVFGILGRKRAKRGEATNGGVALAGIITSVIGMALLAAYVVGVVLLFTSGAGHRFLDCADAAGNDDVANQQCTDQFVRDLGFDPHRSR